MVVRLYVASSAESRVWGVIKPWLGVRREGLRWITGAGAIEDRCGVEKLRRGVEDWDGVGVVVVVVVAEVVDCWPCQILAFFWAKATEYGAKVEGIDKSTLTKSTCNGTQRRNGSSRTHREMRICLASEDSLGREVRTWGGVESWWFEFSPDWSECPTQWEREVFTWPDVSLIRRRLWS